jgi:tRNA uridine 5-carboxymethylaminomethyl modification enzyme
MEFRGLHALSFEAREKLQVVRPRTLGQASRIPGISPSDLHGLVLEVMRHRSGAERPSVSRETNPDGVSRDGEVLGRFT